MKNSVCILLFSLSFQFIAQTKPNGCDVVFAGKKSGWIRKDEVIRTKELRFYNKFCKSKIIEYSFSFVLEGKQCVIKEITDRKFSDDILYVLSKCASGYGFYVKCKDEYGEIYQCVIELKLKD